MTSRGGEWFNVAQIGERSVNNVTHSHIENLLRINDLIKGIFLGTERFNVAITVGIGVERHQGEAKTCGPVRQAHTFSDHLGDLKFERDTLDSLYCPRAGSLAKINVNRVHPGDTDSESFE